VPHYERPTVVFEPSAPEENRGARRENEAMADAAAALRQAEIESVQTGDSADDVQAPDSPRLPK